MSQNLITEARRAHIRDYKQAFPRMGVYAVRNPQTRHAWLGASRDVDGVLNRIRFELRQRSHRNQSLMREWLQFGPDAFVFEVLDRVKPRDDPAFDYEAELQQLLALWQAEVGAQSEGAAP